MKKIAYFFIVICLIFLFLEIGLRAFGLFKTYTEQNFGYYESPYGQVHESHLFKFSPAEKLEYTQKEFSYTYQMNKEGFIDQKNLEDCEPLNTKIVLGDSFLFGVGAAQDSNMVSLLNKLNDSDSIYFFNAGKPDSDPFYQKKLITDYFMPKGYKDFIIAVNISDIYDYIFRRGEERFKKDGTVEYRIAPPLEFWYQRLFLVRAFSYVFFNTDYTLLTRIKLLQEKKNAKNALIDMFDELQENLSANEGSLTIVFHPYPAQYKNSNRKVMQEVLNYAYLNEIHAALTNLNIKSVNLEPAFSAILNNENYLDYTWGVDGHFNSKGYDLYASLMIAQLKF